MNIHDLATPALLLDIDLFESNIARMAKHAEQAGKRLRPHVKAHKCVEIAQRQIAAGAVGVCAATVQEAELMVRAGIGSVLLTSPVADARKCIRVASLSPNIAVVVDHPAHVDLYAQQGVPLDVLIDLDVGDHRTGAASVEAALALASQIQATRTLRLAGLQAYSVQASHTGEQVPLDCVERAREKLGVELVTGGSTGSYLVDAASVLTEIQPGSYALMDLAYRRIGVDFANAMTVLATVISANHDDRVTVDAGFKAFSTDRPFGPEPLDGDGVRYKWAGDEFGYLLPRRGWKPGDRVRLIPPHCDPTVNLYDRIYLHRGDRVEEVWPIMSRTGGRVSSLRPTAINSVLSEVRPLQAQGRKIVSLMRGEPDFPTPPHIRDAAVKALAAGRTSYPDNRGELPLREAVGHKLNYDPATEILITDGATLGIHAALTALVSHGDEVLLPEPIYDAYQSPIRLTGADPRSVRLDDLEAAWTPNTRILLINTPWNPLGRVLTRRELTGIGEFVCRRNLTLISDEIYEAITYDGHKHISPATISSELRDRTVVINSFSKTYAMTGWRLGYCAARADLIRSMFLVLQQSSRGPATFVQDAGVVALTGPQDCVHEMVAEYTRRRRLVIDALTGVDRIKVLPPEGGFFAMVDITATGRTSDDVRRYLLHEHGVAVVHGRAYGRAGESLLRVSFASGGDTLDRGLELLRKGLAAL